MANFSHQAIRDICEDKVKVLTTFDPTDLLIYKKEKLIDEIICRVAGAMVEPIVKLIEPAFYKALQNILREKKDAAKTTAKTETTAEAADSEGEASPD